MRIYLNGCSTELVALQGQTPAADADTDTVSLMQALLTFGYAEPAAPGEGGCQLSGAFVVALNQRIVSASQYASTPIADGDSLDILGAITGG
ncbi:sulfur carrier protein ThiS [Thalassolituus sp. LLYu03]|uniref:sulfur carrier protein ThiS n=1 Tax=Thalassolituus sp. LLYu03 TaxID=3421656 RepID=UPI003D2E83FA